MPERSKIDNDELDDDDEDGSKGEDEEVAVFDEYRDLPPQQSNRAKLQSSRPSNSPVTSYSPTRAGDRKKGPAAAAEDLDTPESQNHVAQVTQIQWPAAAGKRPPRDMKRLVPGEWYIVCKVMKWGDTPALFVRASRDCNGDNGFYKPPAQYYTYHFQVGDRLQLSQVGYSSSRNKVATSIRVKPTHMAEVPVSKLNWVAPPIQDLPPSEPKSKKKSNDGDSDDRGGNSMNKRKKQREDLPQVASIRMQPQGFPEHPSAMLHSFSSPLSGLTNQHAPKKAHYQIFQHQPSFGPGTMGQTQLMSGNNLFAFPSTPDLGLHRGQSFSIVSDLFGNASTNNLMAPQSPVMGPTSPLMGNPHHQAMHRIPSIGGSIGALGGPLGSFSMNSPSTQLTLNYGFPSQVNFNTGVDQSNGM